VRSQHWMLLRRFVASSNSRWNLNRVPAGGVERFPSRSKLPLGIFEARRSPVFLSPRTPSGNRGDAPIPERIRRCPWPLLIHAADGLAVLKDCVVLEVRVDRRCLQSGRTKGECHAASRTLRNRKRADPMHRSNQLKLIKGGCPPPRDPRWTCPRPTLSGASHLLIPSRRPQLR
jgi:hypothetical protein